jgi:hypothetical protein
MLKRLAAPAAEQIDEVVAREQARAGLGVCERGGEVAARQATAICSADSRGYPTAKRSPSTTAKRNSVPHCAGPESTAKTTKQLAMNRPIQRG